MQKIAKIVISFFLSFAIVSTCAPFTLATTTGNMIFSDEMATNEVYLSQCIEQLDTSYNLLDSEYTASITDAPGVIIAEGSTTVSLGSVAAQKLVDHDLSGGYHHPMVTGDTAAAEVLSAFIKDTVLAD